MAKLLTHLFDDQSWPYFRHLTGATFCHLNRWRKSQVSWRGDVWSLHGILLCLLRFGKNFLSNMLKLLKKCYSAQSFLYFYLFVQITLSRSISMFLFWFWIWLAYKFIILLYNIRRLKIKKDKFLREIKVVDGIIRSWGNDCQWCGSEFK